MEGSVLLAAFIQLPKASQMAQWICLQCGRHGFDPWIRKLATHSCSCLENPLDRGAWQAIVHGWDPDWYNWAWPQWLSKSFDWANFSWYLLICMHISDSNTQAYTAESTLTKKRKRGETQLSCRAIIEAACLSCGNGVAKLLSWELHLAFQVMNHCSELWAPVFYLLLYLLARYVIK